MKWVKRILIPVAILALVGVGSFFLYGIAYSRGETAGYDNGYSVGHEAGYSSGKQDGYDEGYVSGKQDGYTEGYRSGEQDGYDDGYSVGHEAGYSSGKTEGYSAGKADGYEEGHAEGMEAGLGHGYTLRDPTYEEAVAFLEQDKTDENEYIEDTYGVYVCSHFSRDVCNNAETEELRCAYVELRYPEEGHAIIAFNTVDKGLVYFEPMSDERAEPVVGKNYYQCIIPKPGYYYVAPSHDDTIMDILVIW